MTDEIIFLTIAETAEILRVSDDLVSELIHQGLLPAAALGRRRVVPRIAIDQLVDVLIEDYDPRLVAARLAAAAPATDPREIVAGTGTTGPMSALRAAPPHGVPPPPTPLRRLQASSS